MLEQQIAGVLSKIPEDDQSEDEDKDEQPAQNEQSVQGEAEQVQEQV